MGRILNTKQERFAQLVAMNVPAIQAYAEAGYDNADFAAENARKLRNKRHVKARIEELSASTDDMVELRRAMLDEFYVLVLKTDRVDIYDDKARLRPLDELRPEHRALIEGIDTKVSQYGETKNLIMPSKLVAAGQLAKLHGLDRPTKIAPTNPTGDGPAEVNLNTTDEDRTRALQAFLARAAIKGKVA